MTEHSELPEDNAMTEFKGVTPYPEWYVLVDDKGMVHHVPKWDYIKGLQDKVHKYEKALKAIDEIVLSGFDKLVKDNNYVLARLQTIEDITQYTLYGTKFVEASAKQALKQHNEAKGE